jgi:hypothetical protein
MMTTAAMVIVFALAVVCPFACVIAWCRSCDLRAMETGKGATDWIAHGRMLEKQADRKRRAEAARLGHLKRRERAEAREGRAIEAMIDSNANLERLERSDNTLRDFVGDPE